ncbi:MAG: EF-hand domain-containing protein [Deltaproteobacteria bacterium]|nr:EF-hand domain-containing protein [Deltaproteobacteria bacterium]
MGTEQQQLVTAIGNYLEKNFNDRSRSGMRLLFDRYDADHDGKIDKAELRRLLEDLEIGNAFTRSAWVRGIMEQLDANADKSISWDEFQDVAGDSA